MAFMQIETCQMKMWHVETTAGTEYVPADLIGDVTHPIDLSVFRAYVEGTIYVVDYDMSTDDDEEDIRDGADAEICEGWYVRESAPGYMDCTEWCGPYDTEADAIREYCEMMDICETCHEQCYYGDAPCPEHQEVM